MYESDNTTVQTVMFTSYTTTKLLCLHNYNIKAHKTDSPPIYLGFAAVFLGENEMILVCVLFFAIVDSDINISSLIT